MADISESVCLNHPDTPAVIRCATCGKPICEQCIVERNFSKYCSEKCAENAANSAGRVNDVLENRKKVDARLRRRAVVILILLAAVAAAGYWFYTQNKSEVDRFVKNAEKKVNHTVQEAKGTIQENIPSSSTYKKNRENLVK